MSFVCNLLKREFPEIKRILMMMKRNVAIKYT